LAERVVEMQAVVLISMPVPQMELIVSITDCLHTDTYPNSVLHQHTGTELFIESYLSPELLSVISKINIHLVTFSLHTTPLTSAGS
jgi:hypothetical protein